MWKKTENSNAEKPEAIDATSSQTTVYFRKNFVFVEEAEDRPAHWEYEEQAVTKDLYDTYMNIDDINNALVELGNIIGEVVNG